jgi:hypothetical protein
VFGGVACPDTLGAANGNYLPIRVTLWGLAIGLAWLNLDAVPQGRARQIASVTFLGAWIIQSAIVFDYAQHCDRVIAPFQAARRVLKSVSPKPGEGIATLLTDVRDPFRVSALLHADNLLGVETGWNVWNNYEAQTNHFPVQFRPDKRPAFPPELDMERLSLMNDPKERPVRLTLWNAWLDHSNSQTAMLAVWGHDAEIDAATTRRFNRFRILGPLALWRRIPNP